LSISAGFVAGPPDDVSPATRKDRKMPARVRFRDEPPSLLIPVESHPVRSRYGRRLREGNRSDDGQTPEEGF
jgi:hypothetical protein